MTANQGAIAEFQDLEPELEDFETAVTEGLGRAVKSLPCKFFYDQRGSGLFDRICTLDEYYPTRTELKILNHHKAEIAEFAQLENGRSRESLGVRGDAKSVARRQAFTLERIGMSVGPLEDNAPLVAHGKNASGLACQTHLEFKPRTGVLKCVP